jgi:hypothetical protein
MRRFTLVPRGTGCSGSALLRALLCTFSPVFFFKSRAITRMWPPSTAQIMWWMMCVLSPKSRLVFLLLSLKSALFWFQDLANKYVSTVRGILIQYLMSCTLVNDFSPFCKFILQVLLKTFAAGLLLFCAYYICFCRVW